MKNYSLSLLLVVALAWMQAGCRKGTTPAVMPLPSAPAPELPTAKPASPEPSASTAEASQNSPAAKQANTSAEVVVLCYHRFEESPRDGLAIKPGDFDRQLVAVKKAGFAIIPMQDFLAWRRGEKTIPEKSCVVTIDDGFRSAYTLAWPILKKHGVPFTLFVYTDYVKGQPKSGGQSMSWAELQELRAAGVDIQSHTVSHQSLRAKGTRTPEQYVEWLRHELGTSKRLLEQQLGIKVTAVAYPYGNHNEEVRRIAREVGYEAAFSVAGQKLGWSSAADQLGRYAIESTNPRTFENAIRMSGGPAPAQGLVSAETTAVEHLAAASMVTQPLAGETIFDAQPTLKANLATFGDFDPASVELRLSGFGLLPAKYNAATQMLEIKIPQPLKPGEHTATIGVRQGQKRVEARWSFIYDPHATEANPDPQMLPRLR